ncbi:MAG: integrin alpha, partial [Patescibacteria group bacterium]
DLFGSSIANVGDLDANGTDDLAVGAAFDDDGGIGVANRGAVWILFMESNGLVIGEQKISDLEGGFTGVLDDFDSFGTAVASMGDADGDGIADIMVGAPGDDDGIEASGALWVLYLNADGTVKSHEKISMTSGNLVQNTLEESASFPSSLAHFGQITGGVATVVAAGVSDLDEGGDARGAVFILFLNADGTIHHKTKITEGSGGFTGDIQDGDQFGRSVAHMGDLDADGDEELAVGAITDTGGTDSGTVWMLSIDDFGNVVDSHPITTGLSGFTGPLVFGDWFGQSVANVGDLDNDGVSDLAVGQVGEGVFEGAVWILFLNADGTVKAEQKISETLGGFTGVLPSNTQFGYSLSALGDLDGDGIEDLAVGSMDDEGGTDTGAVWILFLNADGTVKAHQRINAVEGDFTGILETGDGFSSSLSSGTDVNGDGVTDLFVGAYGDDDGDANAGAFYILYLNTDGTVQG